MGFHWSGRGCLFVINSSRPDVSLYSVSSTVKIFLFPSSRATLHPILSFPSCPLCIPVVSAVLLGGGLASRCWVAKAPKISLTVFFICASSFLVSSVACLVALSIGWKRVRSSSSIASFISRFTILRWLTVFIAVTYSLTRVALSAGSLISRNDVLSVILHTQTDAVLGRACIHV